jgi:hypothetical protein
VWIGYRGRAERKKFCDVFTPRTSQFDVIYHLPPALVSPVTKYKMSSELIVASWQNFFCLSNWIHLAPLYFWFDLCNICCKIISMFPIQTDRQTDRQTDIRISDWWISGASTFVMHMAQTLEVPARILAVIHRSLARLAWYLLILHEKCFDNRQRSLRPSSFHIYRWCNTVICASHAILC